MAHSPPYTEVNVPLPLGSAPITCPGVEASSTKGQLPGTTAQGQWHNGLGAIR